MKKILIKIARTLCCVVTAILAVWLISLLVFKAKYHKYEKFESKIAFNPGLNSGYVPQGCTYFPDENLILTCGYMKDNSASRIYSVQKSKKSAKSYALTLNGKPFTGHTGGLQYSDGVFYLANEGDGIYEFSKNQLLTESHTIELTKTADVPNHSSFIFADDDYIYVGEFYRPTVYECENEITYNKTTHKAVILAYNKGDFSNPVAVYSIPKEIQGMAKDKNGNIILSRSWGLSSSDIYIFSPKNIADTKTTYLNAPLYFLQEPDTLIKARPMCEDLDIKDGNVIWMTELACDKYILGKFLLYFNIYSFSPKDFLPN